MSGARLAAMQRRTPTSQSLSMWQRMAAGMVQAGTGIHSGPGTLSCPRMALPIARLGGASTHQVSFTLLRSAIASTATDTMDTTDTYPGYMPPYLHTLADSTLVPADSMVVADTDNQFLPTDT